MVHDAFSLTRQTLATFPQPGSTPGQWMGHSCICGPSSQVHGNWAESLMVLWTQHGSGSINMPRVHSGLCLHLQGFSLIKPASQNRADDFEKKKLRGNHDVKGPPVKLKVPELLSLLKYSFSTESLEQGFSATIYCYQTGSYLHPLGKVLEFLGVAKQEKSTDSPPNLFTPHCDRPLYLGSFLLLPYVRLVLM